MSSGKSRRESVIRGRLLCNNLKEKHTRGETGHDFQIPCHVTGPDNSMSQGPEKKGGTLLILGLEQLEKN